MPDKSRPDSREYDLTPSDQSRPSDILRQRMPADPPRAASALRRRLIAIYDRPPSRFDSPALLVFVIALIVFLLCVGYFLWGIWGGMLDNPNFTRVLSPADQARVIGNLEFVDKVAILSGMVAALSYTFLLYHEEVAGYILGGFSLILLLAIPALTPIFLASFRGAPSIATHLVLEDIRLLSIVPATPALALIAMDIYVRAYFGIDEARIRAAAQRNARRRLRRKRAPYLFLGPCWREPGGALSRRCLWDDISTKHSSSAQALRRVMNRMDGTASFDPFASSPNTQGVERPLTRVQKKQICRNCRHFLAHQSQKYNVLASISAATVLAVLVFAHDRLVSMIVGTFSSTQTAMVRFTFAPGTSFASMPVSGPPDTMGTMAVAWVILLVTSLIVLTKVLQLLEYCCFKLKI